MEPSTALGQSRLIPTVIPHAPNPQPRAPGPVGRQLVDLRNASLHVGDDVTVSRVRIARESQQRLHEHAHLRAEAMRELGLMAPPNVCPLPDRERLATVIANQVMHRVPPGTPAPLELRVINVQPATGMLAGNRSGGVSFKVVAWGPEAPPPTRPVTDTPTSGWYPHDPLGAGGTELDLQCAPIQVSGQLLLRGSASRLRSGHPPAPLPATAAEGAPGYPVPPGCAPAPSRPPR